MWLLLYIYYVISIVNRKVLPKFEQNVILNYKKKLLLFLLLLQINIIVDRVGRRSVQHSTKTVSTIDQYNEQLSYELMLLVLLLMLQSATITNAIIFDWTYL